MILLCVETSLSLVTEIFSIELEIESNYSLWSDSIDSFHDKTFRWDFYSTWTLIF